jgi:hypothetical protein
MSDDSAIADCGRTTLASGDIGPMRATRDKTVTCEGFSIDWARKDSNLRRHKPSDLQSDPVGHLGTRPEWNRLSRTPLRRSIAGNRRLRQSFAVTVAGASFHFSFCNFQFSMRFSRPIE